MGRGGDQQREKLEEREQRKKLERDREIGESRGGEKEKDQEGEKRARDRYRKIWERGGRKR